MQDEELRIEQMHRLADFVDRLENARQHALADSLTGLATRLTAQAHLCSQLEAGRPTAVVLVDLDRFKDINRRWGHACGDRVLAIVGQTLAEYSGQFSLISRWDGDKFLLFTSDRTDVRTEVTTLCTRLNRHFEIPEAGSNIEVRASFGTALSTAGDTVSTLVLRAGANLVASRGTAQQATAQRVP